MKNNNEKNEEKAHEFFVQGVAKYKLGGYEEAIEYYNKAIQTCPERKEPYFNRGLAKCALENYEEAIKDFDKVIEIDKGYTEAYHNRANIKALLGNYEEAIKDFDKVIGMDNEYTDAYFCRGNVKDQLGRYEEAIENYNKVIEIDNEYTDAYYRRGLTKAYLERYNDAIEDFNKVVQMDEKYKEVYFNRGSVKARLGRDEEAIEDYTEAIKIDNEYTEAYFNLGLVKSRLGRDEEAIEDFDKVIEIDNKYKDAYFNLGNAKAKLGRYEDAIEDYTKEIEMANNPYLYISIILTPDNLDGFKKNKLSKELIKLYLKAFLTNGEINTKIEKIKKSNFNKYVEVLKQVGKIKGSLLIKNEDYNIGHYTNYETLNKVFGDDEGSLKLGPTGNMNDTNEGCIINSILGINQVTDNNQSYCFIGCFTYNYNGLNQFRLYGKENRKEGTGVSFILKNFFDKEGYNQFISMSKEKNFISKESNPISQEGQKQPEDKNKKFPLYKVAYFSAEGDATHIAKYKLSDYIKRNKENKNIIENYYKDSIKELQDLNECITSLKEAVKGIEGNCEILKLILMPIQYLFKSEEYKEEEECRIIHITSNLKSEKLDFISDGMESPLFYNYLESKELEVKEIYFGPNFKNYENRHIYLKHECKKLENIKFFPWNKGNFKN